MIRESKILIHFDKTNKLTDITVLINSKLGQSEYCTIIKLRRYFNRKMPTPWLSTVLSVDSVLTVESSVLVFAFCT